MIVVVTSPLMALLLGEPEAGEFTASACRERRLQKTDIEAALAPHVKCNRQVFCAARFCLLLIPCSTQNRSLQHVTKIPARTAREIPIAY